MKRQCPTGPVPCQEQFINQRAEVGWTLRYFFLKRYTLGDEVHGGACVEETRKGGKEASVQEGRRAILCFNGLFLLLLTLSSFLEVVCARTS